MVSKDSNLSELRQQMDEVDDQLHNLLMERFALVGQIAKAKANEQVAPTVALRPGREAQVLRRLLAQHRGALPAEIVVKVWRELISAATSMQGPYGAYLYAGAHSQLYWDLARFYVGALTPLTEYKSADEVLKAVVKKPNCVGVLPAFAATEAGSGQWLFSLDAMGDHRPRIVARLPFVGGSRTGPDYSSAFVVAASEPEASGDDTSLLSLTAALDMAVADLVAQLRKAGFDGVNIVLSRTGPAGEQSIVASVVGFVTQGDERLAAIVGQSNQSILRLALLGAYANPIDLGALLETRDKL